MLRATAPSHPVITRANTTLDGAFIMLTLPDCGPRGCSEQVSGRLDEATTFGRSGMLMCYDLIIFLTFDEFIGT